MTAHRTAAPGRWSVPAGLVVLAGAWLLLARTAPTRWPAGPSSEALAGDGARLVVDLAWAGAVVLLASLTASTALGLVGRARRSVRLGRAALRLALPGLRPVVARFAGLTLLAGLATPTTIAAAQTAPPPVLLPIEVVSGRPDAGRDGAAVEVPGDAPPTMVLLDGTQPMDGTDPSDDGSPAPGGPAATPSEGQDTWVVAPGDHLWSIAARVLTTPGAPPPPPAVIAPYHQALIDANRDRLVDPGDPDLILPGQELVLPAAAAPPRSPAADPDG